MITASISLAVISLFRLSLSPNSVLEDYVFLEICPFHPDFQISWHIGARSNFLQSLYFRGIGCNFSSFISHFIYLGPLSFFLDNSG